MSPNINPTTMPAAGTEHFVLKRSGWLLLLLVTRLAASLFHECACSSFLIPDLENPPLSSRTRARDRRCASCRRRSIKRNRRWERRARERGTVTPLGVFYWKEEDLKGRVNTVIRGSVVGGMVVAGCVGLWKSRGVWGWWGLPAGFGLWGGLGMRGVWGDDGDDENDDY